MAVMLPRLLGAVVGLVFAGMVTAIIATPSGAATIIADNSSVLDDCWPACEDAQNVGLSSPDVVVDFGLHLFTTNTPITDQFSAQGVTFGPEYAYADSSNDGTSGTVVGGALKESANCSGGLCAAPGSIYFSQVVSGAAFQLSGGGSATLDHMTTFSSLLDGVLVETFVANTSGDHNAIGYYGFEGILFNEIQLSMNHVDFALDNLQYSVAPIPLPAAFPLFATALAGMGLLGWRRKRKVFA